MKELYQARDRLEAQLVVDFLAGYRIRTLLHGAFLGGAAGELPVQSSVPVWILDEGDYARARELLAHYLAQEMHRSDWRCARCDEINEGQFHLCWRCGQAPE